MRRVAFLVTVALATILFVAGCSSIDPIAQTEMASEPFFPFSVTDGNGQIVTIQHSPRRIIAIDSSMIEILFSIDEGSRVVGVHDFVSFPPQVDRIEKVGGAFSLNFERIVSLEPDLIVVFFDAFLPDLRRLGLTVLYLPTPKTLGGISKRMRIVGNIIGEPEKGEQLAQNFEKELQKIQQSMGSAKQEPLVYHDEAPGWWTAGSDTLVNDVYRFLGARNMFEEIDGYAQVSVEEIIARNPEVIISVHNNGLGILKSEPGLRGISAIIDDRILTLDGDYLSIPGPRMIDGVAEIARFLYKQ
jgi:iron complex transport system substrate-binding protein